MFKFRRKQSAEDAGNEVFGVFDGLVSVSGVVIGLIAAPVHAILAAAIGLAAASTVSMGAGEYLGDEASSRTPPQRIRRAIAMGFATLVGTLVPVAPLLLFAKPVALTVAAAIGIGTSIWIAETRAHSAAQKSRSRSYLETFGLFLGAMLVTAIIAILTGAGG